jgi:antitoxin component YwqK of YwqJK toxin-antitoxin module
MGMRGSVYAQSFSQPVFEYPDITSGLWENPPYAKRLVRPWTLIDSVCTISTDSGMVRQEFDDQGSLVRQVRVIQIEGVDTAYTEDIETGDMRMDVTTGITDIPDGHFMEWFREGHFSYREGMIENGRAVGVWRYSNWYRNLIRTIEIGKFGMAEGACVEYHPNGLVKWTGDYGIRRVSVLICPTCPSNLVGFDERHETWTNVPVGVWKQYDDSGKLIQVVSYTWVDD